MPEVPAPDPFVMEYQGYVGLWLPLETVQSLLADAKKKDILEEEVKTWEENYQLSIQENDALREKNLRTLFIAGGVGTAAGLIVGLILSAK